VALGLVNAYMKRCVRKGLIKVQQAPARRYAYYLTPKGFAEKSVLTAEYLTSTLSYFRQARTECGQAIADAKRRGWKKGGISGCGELAEITVLCASEQGIEIAALLAPGAAKTRLLGIDVVATLDDVAAPPDGWVVTEIEGAQKSYDVLASRVGSDFVLVLPMLPVRRTKRSAVTVAGRLTPLTDGQRAVRQRSDQGVE
jgi:hypothetical protein